MDHVSKYKVTLALGKMVSLIPVKLSLRHKIYEMVFSVALFGFIAVFHFH